MTRTPLLALALLCGALVALVARADAPQLPYYCEGPQLGDARPAGCPNQPDGGTPLGLSSMPDRQHAQCPACKALDDAARTARVTAGAQAAVDRLAHRLDLITAVNSGDATDVQCQELAEILAAAPGP